MSKLWATINTRILWRATVLLVVAMGLVGCPGGDSGTPAPSTAPAVPPAVTPVEAVDTDSVEPGFEPRPVVSGQTKAETAKGVTQVEQPTTLSLSDGTSVRLPGTSAPVTVQLERQSTAITLPNPELQTTGSTRVLRLALDPAQPALVPTLTIPAAECAGLDPLTVNVVRIADVKIAGKLVRNHMTVLPARRDAAGNLVVRDVFLPMTAGAAEATEPIARAEGDPRPHQVVASFPGSAVLGQVGVAPATSRRAFSHRVQYVVMTFQKSMNWDRPPRLVRMIPDAQRPEGRRAAHPYRDRAVLSQPIVNVIVLVHGHNEEEKTGMHPLTGPEPWGVSYKRDVWTHFYKVLATNAAYQDRQGCTAIYEFIYPSYRPAYSPMAGRETLGESLAKMLSAGANNDSRQLRRLLEGNAPVNFTMVAHSMGGLVARSAMRNWTVALKGNFQQLVTWGSPHHGSPLPTLGYVLNSPYQLNPMVKDKLPSYLKPRPGFFDEFLTGVGATAGKMTATDLFGQLFEYLAQIDAPGSRDLRWDNGTIENPRLLRLDDFFLPIVDRQDEKDDKVWSLHDGTWLYNENLRLFNRDDPYRLSEKYSFLYGITTKTLERNLGQIAAGATFMPLLMAEGDKPMPDYGGLLEGRSDGAVPLRSMAGVGVCPSYRAINVGDIDHEEYFGAPAGDRFLQPDKAEKTARITLERLELATERCAPPKLVITEPPTLSAVAIGTEVKVDARLDWPKGADPKPGKRVARAEVVRALTNSDTPQVLAALTKDDTGRFQGTFKLPDGVDPVSLRIRATLIDGTWIEAAPRTTAAIPCWVLTSAELTNPKAAFSGDADDRAGSKESWRYNFRPLPAGGESSLECAWSYLRNVAGPDGRSVKKSFTGRDTSRYRVAWTCPTRIADVPNVDDRTWKLAPVVVRVTDLIKATEKRTGTPPPDLHSGASNMRVALMSVLVAPDGKAIDGAPIVGLMGGMPMNPVAGDESGVYLSQVQFRFDPAWWRVSYEKAHGKYPAELAAKKPGEGWKMQVAIVLTHSLSGDIRIDNADTRVMLAQYTFDPTGGTVTPIATEDTGDRPSRMGIKSPGTTVSDAFKKLALLENYQGPQFSTGGQAKPVAPPTKTPTTPAPASGATRLVNLRYVPAQPKAGQEIAFELEVENAPGTPSYSWRFGEDPNSKQSDSWTTTNTCKWSYSRPGTYTINVDVRDKRNYSKQLDLKTWQVTITPAE